MERATKSPPLSLQLEKRDANFFRYGFAVCELPFYEICRDNVSRIECSELGCCFYKQACYKKAVPEYMKAFVGLIVFIFVIFILFVLYRCFAGESKKKPKNKTLPKKDKSVEKENQSNTSSTDTSTATTDS
ncbi:testis-expressed protein 29 [Paroedura picta]|uniref:testis-expressed protein 29 n=1 Tax=Paroedura picta TaxID=143630 RepID=UPI004057A555